MIVTLNSKLINIFLSKMTYRNRIHKLPWQSCRGPGSRGWRSHPETFSRHFYKSRLLDYSRVVIRLVAHFSANTFSAVRHLLIGIAISPRHNHNCTSADFCTQFSLGSFGFEHQIRVVVTFQFGRISPWRI